MSSISLISAAYETVADLRLDQDIVISVDLTDVLYDDIVSHRADAEEDEVEIQLSNHAVNDIIMHGDGIEKMTFKLPEQLDGKSRHFMIRLDHPAQCAYAFVDNNDTPVQLQSNSGKLLSIDESMTHSVTLLDCYEVSQQPTTMFIGVESNLSIASLHRSSLV